MWMNIIHSHSVLNMAIHICVVGGFMLAGCLPKSKSVTQSHQRQSEGLTRVEEIQNLVDGRLTGCGKSLALLEADAESAVPDLTNERALWRSAREQYEQVRFFVEEFYPEFHSVHIAPWFSSSPQQGFHYIERILFSSSSSPSWTNIDGATGGMNTSYVQIIIGAIYTLPVPDSGIFKGLQHMLADIDTVKFSGLDREYSGNSMNDVFSNYTGLDTVYGYYSDSVYRYSPAIDSIFKARWKSAWENMPADSNSFYTMNKQNYDSLYLHPLEDAVKQVATVFGAQLQ